jgi:hypothetical protein
MRWKKIICGVLDMTGNCAFMAFYKELPHYSLKNTGRYLRIFDAPTDI